MGVAQRARRVGVGCRDLSDGRRVLAAVPETVSPEWGTEEECVRDAIGQGRDLIDRGDVARCRP